MRIRNKLVIHTIGGDHIFLVGSRSLFLSNDQSLSGLMELLLLLRWHLDILHRVGGSSDKFCVQNIFIKIILRRNLFKNRFARVKRDSELFYFETELAKI